MIWLWLSLDQARYPPGTLCGLKINVGLLKSIFNNTLRPRQNGRHFADTVYNCIFVYEIIWISNKASLKYFLGLTDNISALVQIMAWRRPGDKPLPVPMLTVHRRIHVYAALGLTELTYCGQKRNDGTFSNAFSLQKYYAFGSRFYWCLLQGSNRWNFIIDFRNGLAPKRRPAT